MGEVVKLTWSVMQGVIETGAANVLRGRQENGSSDEYGLSKQPEHIE